MDLLLSIVIGVSLAAACGFRVFVPLLIMSIAARTGDLTLAPGLDWIGSEAALFAFAFATALEIGGYYVPWIDNLLDSIATPAAVVAGTLTVGAVVTEMDPFLKWALALVAGGGTAGAIQSITVLARGSSSLATGGMANPVLSTAEAGGSIVTAGFALLLPWVAIFLVAGFLVTCLLRLTRRRKPRPPKQLAGSRSTSAG